MARFVKVLVAAAVAVVSVMAGAVVLIAVAALFIGFLLARVIRRRFSTGAPRPTGRRPADRGNVIDVVATEVTTSAQSLPGAGHFSEQREKP